MTNAAHHQDHPDRRTGRRSAFETFSAALVAPADAICRIGSREQRGRRPQRRSVIDR